MQTFLFYFYQFQNHVHWWLPLGRVVPCNYDYIVNLSISTLIDILLVWEMLSPLLSWFCYFINVTFISIEDTAYKHGSLCQTFNQLLQIIFLLFVHPDFSCHKGHFTHHFSQNSGILLIVMVFRCRPEAASLSHPGWTQLWLGCLGDADMDCQASLPSHCHNRAIN